MNKKKDKSFRLVVRSSKLILTKYPKDTFRSNWFKSIFELEKGTLSLRFLNVQDWSTKCRICQLTEIKLYWKIIILLISFLLAFSSHVSFAGKFQEHFPPWMWPINPTERRHSRSRLECLKAGAFRGMAGWAPCSLWPLGPRPSPLDCKRPLWRRLS